jgi:hypothetical protein
MRLGKLASSAALASVLTGCGCASYAKFAAANRDLSNENFARSEPAMRRAAARFRATLTDAEPVIVDDVPCESLILPNIPPEGGCIFWEAGDGRLFRFQDSRGKRHVGVRLSSPSLPFARLARNGNSLVLLLPKVHRHKVGERTRCQCSAGAYPEFSYSFVLEDFEPDGLDVVEVTVIEDYIDWRCKETAV